MMQFFDSAYAWFHTHPGPYLLALWLVGTVLTVAMRARTPEEWVALADSQPRLQGAIKLMRKVFPDLPGALRAMQQIVTGAAETRGVPLPPRLYAPPVDSGDMPTPTPRNDKPRGVAQVRVLAVLALLTAIPLSPAVHLAGCAWLSAKAPVVKRVVKAVTGACTGYAVVVPDVGPVCLVLSQIDQILEDVLAAKRDGVAYRLTVDVDGVEREVAIPPEQLAAFAQHVGQVSATGHAAPAASGSAGAR